MYIYLTQDKTRRFKTNNNAFGIHLLKPDGREIGNAIETALKNGFKHIYIYNSAESIVDTANKVSEYTGIHIGWGQFCLSVPSFRLDFDFVD